MRMLRCTFFLAVLLLTTGRLFAQAGATGTILGTVTDSTGAIVPGAKVTVTNTATNAAFQTVSSSSGDYNAPSLNPGVYKVTVVAPGFQKSVTNTITLTVDQKIRVDVSLKPGTVNTTLEVTAQSVVLDTDTAAQSQLLSQAQVANLPLNGRNFMQLLLVTAGAVTVGGEQGTMRQGVGNAVSVNGGRPEGNNYTLDGLVNTDPALVTPAVILSQDAIQEFKVESGTYSAEYGFSASQINIVSKGGTNSLHGSVFEFNRNNDFDAKPFPTATDILQLKTPTALPVLHQNQFGFVADGPVYIPKIYNGRNKTFWMANYEGWRINNGSRVSSSLPNPAALGGDFSQETSIDGGALPAYGTTACTTELSKNHNCMPVDPMTGQPFPNNMIPTQRITNRLALVAAKYNYFLAPTVAQQAEGTTNFVENIALPLTTNQQTYRVDQNLGRLGSIFGRGTYSKYQNSAIDTATLTYGLLTQYETQKNWEVSHTITLGKASVNNFRFGYLDAQAPQGAPAPPTDAVSALGETGVFTKFTALQQTWPSLAMSQFSTTGGPINAYTGSDAPAWEFADSFSTIHGRHTIGLGIDYRRWRLIRNLDDDFYGDWSFSASTITTNNVNGSCPNATGLCGTGNAIADMLLGYYSGAAGYVPGPLSPTDQAGNPQTHVFSYLAPYVEDDWKVSQKLTLNLGLRWDFRAAAYEAQNHFFWLDTKNANGGLCYADPKLTSDGVAPGGVAGDPVLRYCGSVPHPGSKTPFAPRFGFAYRINNKTVIRGGYGIFFDSYEGREIDDSADIYPYSIRNSLNPNNDPTLPKFGNQLFPSYSALAPFPLSTLSFIAVIESENPINPYVQSRTLSVEREMAPNTTLELSYIGTHAVHLLDRHNIAQPYPIAADNATFCAANPTDTAHNCPTTTRLPYKNFTGFYIDSDFHGYSHYNAANVKLNRSSGNLALTAVYTWAKSLDDKSAAAGVGATGSGYQGFMNNHDPALDYGPSDFNVTQRFVASYIYQLPIGRGKKLLGTANRATDAIVGGWTLSGITTFQSGFPFSVTASDALSLDDTQFQRADYTRGCDIHSGASGLQRINMACFSQPGAGTFGNIGRNTLRQPGINNWDMGLGKSIDITEHAHFELHLDTFNTFNHHQYDISVGGLATGGSGGGSAVDNGVGDALAGKITSSGTPRVLQLSGKFTF
jgi:Carboxypeptidase regulatory-like domain